MSINYLPVFKSYSILPEFAAVEYIALFSLEYDRLVLQTEMKQAQQSSFWQISMDEILKIVAENELGTGSKELPVEEEAEAPKNGKAPAAKAPVSAKSTAAAPDGGSAALQAEIPPPDKPVLQKTEKINYIVRKLESSGAELFLMIQSRKEIAASTAALFTFMSANLASICAITSHASQERFKTELGKLREFQARLFPKFTSVTSLDISSVYLPADLMSGNFIDAFSISESIYQIIVCSIGGYDAQSSFAGASIRTIIRTSSSPKFAPSGLIKYTIDRIERVVHGLNSMISLTVIQFNINSGDARISSFGSPNLLFASRSHKRAYNLNDSQAGKDLAKRSILKDLTVHVEGGDTLLYFSSGVTMAADSRGAYFGKERLVQEFAHSMDEPSIVITQNISEAIYSFTDYVNTQEDIILLAVKRK